MRAVANAMIVQAERTLATLVPVIASTVRGALQAMVGHPLAQLARQGNTLRPRRFAATAMTESTARLDRSLVKNAMLGNTKIATEKVAPPAPRDSGVSRGPRHVRIALRGNIFPTRVPLLAMRAVANAMIVLAESTAAALVPVLAPTVLMANLAVPVHRRAPFAERENTVHRTAHG